MVAAVVLIVGGTFMATRGGFMLHVLAKDGPVVRGWSGAMLTAFIAMTAVLTIGIGCIAVYQGIT